VPSTVADIFAAAGVSPAGVVRWGTPPALPVDRTAHATGIYVVALTDELDSRARALAVPPISEAAIEDLLAVRPELTLDGARPTREQLVQRLAGFWFPDEVVVYIGLAGARKNRPVQGEVAKRVGEYYSTPLGANGPHAGGWPLKTLVGLHEVYYVHYAYCDRVNQAEKDCIGQFAKHVSAKTRARLHDPVRVMPFANLEFPKGNPKSHGIRGARAPKIKRGAKPPITAAARASLAPPARPPAPRRPAPDPVRAAVSPHHRSQNVTAKDIEVGQVRIPIGATKTILPPVRQDIVVVLRGRKMTSRWDPRYGEKERSGVIRVGKAAAADLLSPGDVLAVSVATDGSVGLD
jgi:hypothetical protein